MSAVAGELTAGRSQVQSAALSTTRFRRNLLSNAGGNVANTALQFGLLALLFQLQSTAEFAAMMTATALVGVCEMASDYGARLWATREFSYSRQPRLVLQHSAGCKLFYTLLCAALLLLMPANNLSVAQLLVCVLIATTQPSSDPLLWYLRGRERLDIEAGVVFAFRTAGVVGMAACAIGGLSISLLLFVWLATNCARILLEMRLQAVGGVFEAVVGGESLKPQAAAGVQNLPVGGNATLVSSASHPELHLTVTAIFRTIGGVFPVGTTLFLTSLYQRIGVLLLSVLATDSDVQIFGTAFRVVSTAGFLSTSLFVSSFAALSRAIHADDLSEIRRIVRGEMHLVTLVFLPVCLLGILAAIPLSHAFQNPTIVEIARIIVILLPGLYLSCVNMGMKYVVNAWSLNWLDVLAVVCGMGVFAGLTMFHGGLSWSVAPALGWGLGEGTILLCRLLILRRMGRKAGVPLGLISGTSLILTAAAWVIVT